KMDPRPLLTMRDMGMDMKSMHGMKMDGMDKTNAAHAATASSAATAQPMEGMQGMSGMSMEHGEANEPMQGMQGVHEAGAHPVYAPAVHTGVGTAFLAQSPTSRLDDPGVGLNDNGRRDLTYADLKSLDAHPDPAPERTFVLHLTGNMERYMWSFNGKKYAESVPLKLHYGERVRIVLINDTMMNHPIHLHGMFMELQNGHGVHNPLLHTVNVQPGERLSMLVTADAPGGWALHCHLLYHMEAGMFREVQVAPPPGSSGAAIYSTPAFADRHSHKTDDPPPHAQTTIADTKTYSQVLIDQLEYQSGVGDSPDALAWDAQAWFGGDYQKLWFKTEGIRSGGHTEDANLSAFYDRPFSPYFDFQAGVRHDFGGGPARNWAAFGIQGLAPYFFDLELTGYVGPGGRTAARAKVRYEWLFTQRLILEPELETNLYGRDDPARRIGSGLSDASLGLRLRYEFSRKFAPFVGVEYTRTFGRTSDYRRADGGRTSDTVLLVGLRAWFD
ncbi:MAG: copper resistance protein B, partial [Gammaproteobacteria bacterium]